MPRLKHCVVCVTLILTTGMATSLIDEANASRATRAVRREAKLSGPIRANPRTVRFPDPAAVGLPERARVNAAMFRGIKLDSMQATRIVGLAEGFARERTELLGGVGAREKWDAPTRERMAPFLAKQRDAYRAVLTPEQRLLFDRNSDAILTAWRSR